MMIIASYMIKYLQQLVSDVRISTCNNLVNECNFIEVISLLHLRGCGYPYLDIAICQVHSFQLYCMKMHAQ